MRNFSICQGKNIKQLLTALLFVLVSENAISQELSTYTQTVTSSYQLPDSKSKKKFWLASAEWTLAQVIPWAANRYLRKADFARINFKTVQTNLQLKNWEWDDNQFFTNQFSHPFHGSLYFNAFRSNGYSFWESAPASVFGTYAWETIMEKHLPAPNDLLNTALGGIALGEMTNRVSQLIIGRRKNKSRSWLADPAAFIINPMGGFTRITSGNWGKPVTNEIKTSAILVLDGGFRQGTDKVYDGGTKNAAFAKLGLQYGEVFENSKKAFSNFSLNAEFSTDDSSTMNALQVEGSLFTKKICGNNNTLNVINVTINYDFLKNHFFKYGSQGIRVNYISKFTLNKNIELQCKAGFGILVLAALPNTYMLYGEGRDYDYCSGATIHLGAGLNFANRVFFNFNSNAGYAATINGFESTHYFQNSKAELRVRFYKGLSLSASSSNYYFNGNYVKLTDVHEHYNIWYAGIGYKFIL